MAFGNKVVLTLDIKAWATQTQRVVPDIITDHHHQ
jgi:hypothetical protein